MSDLPERGDALRRQILWTLFGCWLSVLAIGILLTTACLAFEEKAPSV